MEPNSESSPAPVPDSKKSGPVCHTVTLTDEPEETDAFSGPHKRIAEAIADMIRPPKSSEKTEETKDPEETKKTKPLEGIAIGIEGSWGSGKSTVARLLTNQLTDPNMAVVPFDAWAHEGDPLRRTFLETIIKKFQERKWVDEDEWKQRIDELANRREVVTTRDNLTVTTWGKVIAFTLLLVPLGGAFIGAAVREQFTFEPGPLAVKVLVLLSIGLLLSFGPLLVFLFRYKKNPDLLSLLFNKGVSEKTTETSKTVEPTSIEFEERFKTLLEEALVETDPNLLAKNDGEPIGKNQRRVVLILDNLDRVDAKDALSIWSTLQTFFQHKGTDRPEWHKRLWLLVLYDLAGLSQLWQKDGNAPSADTSASFIDKSFQIRFEVPRLVPSDWRQFLIERLKEAFEDHTDFDRHQVYRVLAISELKHKRLPTIRELKLFVNQIAGIHRQWAAGATRVKDTFPLGHIACYVALRRNKVDVIDKLYADNFPEKEYVDLLGPTLRENLAGLAFNVESSVAQQLLYSDKIKAALVDRKADELKQAAQLLGKAFWDTFERIATTEWAGTEASKMADAALTLDESGLLTTPFEPSAWSVTKAICDHAESVEVWSYIDKNKAKGLAVLLKWKMALQAEPAQFDHFIGLLFESIAAGLRNDTLREDTLRDDLKFVARDWLENLEIISHDLMPSAKERAFRVVFERVAKDLESPLEASQVDPFLEVLSELQERPEIISSSGKNLPEMVRDGKISRLMGTTDDRSTATAWVLYVLSRYDSEFAKLKENTIVPVNDAMLETFAEILERFGQTSLLFDMVKVESSFENLVVGSLAFALNKPVAKELFVGDTGVERLEFVFRELDRDEEEHQRLRRLFSQVPDHVSVAENLMRKSFDPAVANLYLLILEKSDGRQESFTNWCVAGLRSVTSDTWNMHVFGSDRLLDLAFYLNRVIGLELGESYFQELATGLEKAVDSGWKGRPFGYENLPVLIGPLESPFRYQFQDRVRSIIQTNKELPNWFFEVVGPELGAQLSSSRGQQVIEIFELILGGKERAGLEWLNETLTRLGPSLEEKYSATPGWTKLREAASRALISHRFKVETIPLVKNIAALLQAKPFENGAIAFAAFDGSRIVSVVPGSTEEETLIEHPFSDYPTVGQPAWSPDGKKIAFIATTVLGRDDIFVRDEASGEITKVTNGPASSRQPCWSPDGKFLTFTRVDDSKSDIYTINLETSEEERVTEIQTAEHPSWSPDALRIVLQRKHSDGSRNIVFKHIGIASATFRHDGSDPSWSPDGQLIAFVFGRGNARTLCIINADGDYSLKELEQGDVYNPEWSPDNSRLLYQIGKESDARIFSIAVDGQNKTELGKGIYPSWQPVMSDGPADKEPESTAQSS